MHYVGYSATWFGSSAGRQNTVYTKAEVRGSNPLRIALVIFDNEDYIYYADLGLPHYLCEVIIMLVVNKNIFLIKIDQF